MVKPNLSLINLFELTQPIVLSFSHSIDALPPVEWQNLESDCNYSPAKRRGPVPGTSKAQTQAMSSTSAGSTRKADQLCNMKPEIKQESSNKMMVNAPSSTYLLSQSRPPDFGTSLFGVGGVGNTDLRNQNRNLEDISRLASLSGAQTASLQGTGMYNSLVNGMVNEDVLNLLQHQQQLLYGANPRSVMGLGLNTGGVSSSSVAHVPPAAATQQQHNYIQQLQAAKQLQLAGQGAEEKMPANLKYLQEQLQAQSLVADEEIRRLRARVERATDTKAPPAKTSEHLSRLLSRSSLEGNRLRSYYELSVNELINLPPIPSDEDYCKRLPVPLQSPMFLPCFDLAALNSARFAELALGALVSNQLGLSLELSNATISCLRDCVEEPIHPLCMFDLARAYYLHAILLFFRGETEKAFQYRFVCLTYLNQIGNTPGAQELLAAVAFQDTWAYLFNKADDSTLSIGQRNFLNQHVERPRPGPTITGMPSIASNPDNQMWLSLIFTNNEAPALARSLDALACAVRSCFHPASVQLEHMAKSMLQETQIQKGNELCNRNLILSAFTLLRQYEASSNASTSGHRMAIHLLDAFLVNTGDESGGFSGEQIKNLLSACYILIDHPLLLYQPGPIYHMMTNAAVLLCHLLNGLFENRRITTPLTGGMETELFQEILDTFISVRILLDSHRKKMPVRLRCHGIPRPNISLLTLKESEQPEVPFIDLGKTLLCFCPGCHEFVLVACSPCVAAEKAQAARLKQQSTLHEEFKDPKFVSSEPWWSNLHQEAKTDDEDKGRESSELSKELSDLGIELDLEDDSLLGVLSHIISM